MNLVNGSPAAIGGGGCPIEFVRRRVIFRYRRFAPKPVLAIGERRRKEERSIIVAVAAAIEIHGDDIGCIVKGVVVIQQEDQACVDWNVDDWTVPV